MRVTKFEHAMMIVETDGARILIDPGGLSRAAPAEGVDAVVVTHLHPDHWTAEQLGRVLAGSPEARVLGPAGVASAVGDAASVEVVEPGDVVDVRGTRLRFTGGAHAVIHSSIPVVDNVGVLVDETFFYGGDALVPPEGVAVELLAAPAGAPWLKIGEAIDYVLAVAPRRAFGVHEEVLSEAGLGMAHDRLRWATEQGDGEYLSLAAGDAVDA